MKNIEITTCNAIYKNEECIGGYHEVHKINYLQNLKHLFATIESIINNNLLYGCDKSILEEVVVKCDEHTCNEIDNHYQGKYNKVNIITEIVYNLY